MLPYTNFHRHDLILNLINHYGPTTRTELIALTDLRPATIGEIIKDLLDQQQIIETGAVSGGHGRRRILLEINREYLSAIGIAFGRDKVAIILSRIDGSIITQQNIPLTDGMSKRSLCIWVTQAVTGMIRSNPNRKVVGIGICNPLYDPLNYEVRESLLSGYQHFNDWVKEDLIASLEQETNIPVSSYSAVTLPAMAECRFGVAKGKQNFICVELSNGIGSSICAGGVVISGAGGVAGELGHTVMSPGGKSSRICYCGKPGCVECETAYPALRRQIQNALKEGVFSLLASYHENPMDFTVADLARALKEGDRMCRHYVRENAQLLGSAIANAVTLLNPELVVLFGFMVELGDFFLEELEKAIRSNVLVLSDTFDIRISEAPDVTYPLGAAAEVFASYLKTDQYQWIYRTDPALRPQTEEQKGTDL